MVVIDDDGDGDDGGDDVAVPADDDDGNIMLMVIKTIIFVHKFDSCLLFVIAILYALRIITLHHWNEKVVILTKFMVVTQMQPVTAWVVTWLYR